MTTGVAVPKRSVIYLGRRGHSSRAFLATLPGAGAMRAIEVYFSFTTYEVRSLKFKVSY